MENNKLEEFEFVPGEIVYESNEEMIKERPIWKDPDVIRFMTTGEYPKWDSAEYLNRIDASIKEKTRRRKEEERQAKFTACDQEAVELNVVIESAAPAIIRKRI